MLETLSWEVLPHAAYPPDYASSNYHLFTMMCHALAEYHFSLYKDTKKWLNEWFTAKGEDIYWHGILKCPKDGKNCISNGAYFEYTFYHSTKFNVLFNF